jgi:predicted nucleic acid-binding protein
MEYPKIVVDTSIVIDHLRKSDKSRSILYEIADKYEFCFSAVTIFELLAGATDDRKRKDVNNILKTGKELVFTGETAKTAALIYQKLKSENSLIGVSDIFIGASAVSYGLPLATLNKKHFERIPHLKIISS